jgi:tetratricopeptide (TPR) repeat protein
MRRLLALLLLLLPAAASFALPDPSLFDRLKAAPTAEEAGNIAADIWAGWYESGSATVDVLLARAREAENFDDKQTARGHYDRILLIKPDFAEAYHRRAGLFLAENNTPEALRDLNEALEIEPRHFGAWMALGVTFESMGADKQALEAYREAIKLYPLLPQALSAEARLSQKLEGREL